MSKSLKNFITIDEILQKHSARQLRLAFLTQLWNSKMDFSESLMAGEVKTIETTMNNFFTMVKALINQVRDGQTVTDGKHQYHGPERALTDESVIHSLCCLFFPTYHGIVSKIVSSPR